jgi:hypothetical protein
MKLIVVLANNGRDGDGNPINFEETTCEVNNVADCNKCIPIWGGISTSCCFINLVASHIGNQKEFDFSGMVRMNFCCYPSRSGKLKDMKPDPTIMKAHIDKMLNKIPNKSPVYLAYGGEIRGNFPKEEKDFLEQLKKKECVLLCTDVASNGCPKHPSSYRRGFNTKLKPFELV